MSDEPPLEFSITYGFDFKLIRLIQNALIPTELSVTAIISRDDDAEDHEVELGLSKCKYWFDNVVPKTIAFSRDNKTAFDMLIDDEGNVRVGNVFMMVPDDPRDELLGAIFQSKMNAFANGAFFVEAIEVHSDNLNGVSFSLLGNHSSYLPQTMEDWLGGPSYFDVPWWKRDDASTLDVYLPEGADKAKTPTWAFALDFLDKTKVPVTAVSASTPHPKGEAKQPRIINLFQPKIIKGGKDGDK